MRPQHEIQHGETPPDMLGFEHAGGHPFAGDPEHLRLGRRPGQPQAPRHQQQSTIIIPRETDAATGTRTSPTMNETPAAPVQPIGVASTWTYHLAV